MKNLIEKIENTSDIDEKIRLLEALRRVVMFYLRLYKKKCECSINNNY